MISACRSWATRAMASRSSSSMATSRMFSGGSESVMRYAFASEEKVIFGMRRMLTRRVVARQERQRLRRPDFERVVGQEVERARLRGYEAAGRGGSDGWRGRKDGGRAGGELRRELGAGQGHTTAVGAEMLIDVGHAARKVGDVRRQLLAGLGEIGR